MIHMEIKNLHVAIVFSPICGHILIRIQYTEYNTLLHHTAVEDCQPAEVLAVRGALLDDHIQEGTGGDNPL